MAVDVSLREQREATVLEHIRTENEHDFDGCIAAFSHPRYEIMATGEVWDGHEGVDALMHENQKGFSDFRFEAQEWHHGDTAVVVEGRFRGTQDGNWRGLPPTGREVDFPLVAVYRFEGENLICERTYFDINTALCQLGVARDPNSTSGRVFTALNHPIAVIRAAVRGLFGRS
jgi:predicted ester cyclase